MRLLAALALLALLAFAFPSPPSGLYPVSGAVVELVDLRSGQSLVLRTDGNGQVTAEMVSSPHRVRVYAYGGYAVYQCEVDGPRDLEIVLERGSLLRGRLVTANGTPVGGACISVSVPGWPSKPPWPGAGAYSWKPEVGQLYLPLMFSTDAEGRFEAPLPARPGSRISLRVEAGDYAAIVRYVSMVFGVDVRAFLPETLKEAKEVFLLTAVPSGRGVAPTSLPVDINDTIVEVRVVAEPSICIDGYVRSESGEPIPGAVVVARVGERLVASLTDEHGYYRICSGVERGSTITLEAVAEGHVASTVDALTATSDMTVNFTLSRSAVLRVFVVDSRGTPIPGTTVLLMRGSRLLAMRTTDGRGVATFSTNVPGGRLTVRAVRLDWVMTASSEVEVPEAGEGAATLILGTAVGRIAGRVVCSSVPLAGVKVVARAKAGFITVYSEGVSSSDGSFSLIVPTRDMLGRKLVYNVTVPETYHYTEGVVEGVVAEPGGIVEVEVTVTKKNSTPVKISVLAPRLDFSLRTASYAYSTVISGIRFTVEVSTNSTVLYGGLVFATYPGRGELLIALCGPAGTQGYLAAAVSKRMMAPPYTVLLDGAEPPSVSTRELDHKVLVEVRYSHSARVLRISSAKFIPDVGQTACVFAAVALALALAARCLGCRGSRH